MKRLLPFLLLIVISALALMGCVASSPRRSETTPAGGVFTQKGITYAVMTDMELKLNLASPAKGRGPFPAIIFLYGGGYAEGSRDVWGIEIELAAQRGYVGVAIDYRLTSVRENGSPKYPFPSQIHDAKCAVRWLRANARKYAIDGERIGVIGFSAGGNLALMLGLTEPSDGLEGTCGDLSLSTQVQAVVNLAGGTDLVLHHDIYPWYMQPLLGGTPGEVPDQYKAASPITYVGGNDSPVLTICGTLDPSLPQQKLLDERMRLAGSTHTLLVVEGARHTQFSLINFYLDNPVWSFFEKYLKGRK